MEQDIFDIIKIKSYAELTEAEMLEVNEMVGTEDEYLNMQMVLNEVDAFHSSELIEPRKETKESLDAIFAAESFPKVAPVWYNGFLTTIYPKNKKFYQRPLVQAAAILLLFLSILPFTMNSSLKDEAKLAFNDVKKMDPQSDTEMIKRDVITKTDEEVESLENNQSQTKQVQANDRYKGGDFEDLNREITKKSLGFSSDPVSTGSLNLTPAGKFELGASRASSDHPDGVFRDKDNSSASFSVPVSRQPEILDLLTATF